MGARWLVCLAFVASCVEPQLKPCGDVLCSADSVCLPNGLCASQEAVDACVGKPEGAACDTPLFTGSCVAGACTPPRCGDGVVSGSEQCDGSVTGIDCVTYGFDLGVPTCSDRCSLDVVGACARFGWERLLAEPAQF